MPVRPVIEIELNDAAFQRFYELFQDYNAELEKQPESWRALSEAMGDGANVLAEGSITAKEALAIGAAQAAVIAESLERAMKGMHGLGSETASTAKHMTALQTATKGISSTIASVGGWLVKLGAFGGLGALMSGFGIADLAGAAFTRTKAAGQLGISPGALASFQVNMQQFLDSSAIQSAAAQQMTYQSAPYLQMLGLPFQRAMAESPRTLAQQEYRAAALGYQQAKTSGIAFAQTRAGIAAAGLGLDSGSIRNIALHLSEFDLAVQQTNRDIGILGFSGKTGQEWTKLKVTLDRAGLTIQTALIDSLAPLAPEIGELATDVATFISTFLNEKDFGIVVKDVKTGLKDLEQFLEGVNWKKIGGEIEWLAEKLGWMVPGKDAKPKPINQQTAWERLWTYDDWGDWVAQGTVARAKLLAKEMRMYGSAAGKDLSEAIGKGITWMTGGTYAYGATGIGSPLHNPLDMKIIMGGQTSFARFPSSDAGIRGGAKRLAEYPALFGADTLAKIIPIWAPSADRNNPVAYLKNVVRWSGVSPTEPMSKWTKAQFASVISAMSREEGTDPVTIAQVIRALFGAELELVARHHTALAHHAVTTAKEKRVRKHGLPPVHVSVTNTTAARVAVSVNAAAVS